MMPDFAWSIVVPVKVLARAKSRLAPLGSAGRAELALAMAVDTVTAALACPEASAVVVVTDDALAAGELTAAGAVVVADEPADGLNAALAHGAAWVRARRPRSGVVALSADLPALRPADVGAALRAAAAWPQAFVPDAQGAGTTMYAATSAAAFRPAFGVDSRRRHADGGAVELVLPGAAGLRRDVDTLPDLRAAARLGLGPRTGALAKGALWAAC